MECVEVIDALVLCLYDFLHHNIVTEAVAGGTIVVPAKSSSPVWWALVPPAQLDDAAMLPCKLHGLADPGLADASSRQV